MPEIKVPAPDYDRMRAAGFVEARDYLRNWYGAHGVRLSSRKATERTREIFWNLSRKATTYADPTGEKAVKNTMEGAAA